MKNPKNSSSLAFVALIWTTLLVLWAWNFCDNFADKMQFKHMEDIVNGSP